MSDQLIDWLINGEETKGQIWGVRNILIKTQQFTLIYVISKSTDLAIY